MCGIVGIVNLNGNKAPLDPIKRMTDAIAHRGPDGDGFWNNPKQNAAFGHRRLSIIDLSITGAQPMHYFDKRYTIVYNGEIYNYVELKSELIKKGFKFYTESDTEVLLAIYHHKRENCLNDLDGMFSFAIWDEYEQELFCARDRFGEKPFFYTIQNDNFIFASEIKAFHAVGIGKKIDYDKLQLYLSDGLLEHPVNTFFIDIYKLEQSHFLKIKNGNITIKRYFDLIITDAKIYKNEDQYVEHFNDLLLTSIRRRLRSDVPVGTSLSGGLDSSTIVCYMNKLLGQSQYQKTFSARFYDNMYDEGKWMKIVEKETNVKRHEVFPDPQVMAVDINKITYGLETPLGSISNCVQYYVMQLAKKNNVKVLLDGQGADEFLGGYELYRQYAMWELFYRFKFSKFFNERKLHRQNYNAPLSLGYYFIPRAIFSKIFTPGNNDNKMYQSLKAKLRNDLMYNLPELLASADRNSMAHSIETRLPFLSHELVNFALSCPTEMIFDKATTKVILRKAIKGAVPEVIINRKDKLHYSPRQELWLHYFTIPEKYDPANAGLIPSNRFWRNYSTSKFLETFDRA